MRNIGRLPFRALGFVEDGRRLILQNTRLFLSALEVIAPIASADGELAVPAIRRKICIRAARQMLDQRSLHVRTYFASAALSAPATALLLVVFMGTFKYAWIVTVLGFVIMAAILGTSRLFNVKIRNAVGRVVATTIYILILLAMYEVLARSVNSRAGSDLTFRLPEAAAFLNKEIARTAMAAILFWFVHMFLATLMNSIALWLTELSERRRRPVSVITRNLLLIASHLKDEHSFKSTTTVRDTVQYLELIARAVEGGLSLRVRFAASSMSVIVTSRMREAAAAVREKQIWAALPDHQTRVDLLDFSATLFVTILSGSLHNLPQPERIDGIPTRNFSTLLSTARSLFGACVPLGTVVMLQKTQLLPSGTAGIGIWIVAALLALVSFMTLIDPGFTNRLAGAKDMLSIWKDTQR